MGTTVAYRLEDLLFYWKVLSSRTCIGPQIFPVFHLLQYVSWIGILHSEMNVYELFCFIPPWQMFHNEGKKKTQISQGFYLKKVFMQKI